MYIYIKKLLHEILCVLYVIDWIYRRFNPQFKMFWLSFIVFWPEPDPIGTAKDLTLRATD